MEKIQAADHPLSYIVGSIPGKALSRHMKPPTTRSTENP